MASSKFKVGQFIQHNGFPAKYEVIKTPDTCIHNEKPHYQLKHITLGPKTAPFFRSQDDVETSWKEYSNE